MVTKWNPLVWRLSLSADQILGNSNSWGEKATVFLWFPGSI